VLILHVFVLLSGMVFASGLATTTAITFLLKQGDHLISMDDLYGGNILYPLEK
jgi:O-acetylhomoserine/O-acetylserine sulfhydrylase-like pyridoxal-dependent enzyme